MDNSRQLALLTCGAIGVALALGLINQPTSTSPDDQSPTSLVARSEASSASTESKSGPDNARAKSLALNAATSVNATTTNDAAGVTATDSANTDGQDQRAMYAKLDQLLNHVEQLQSRDHASAPNGEATPGQAHGTATKKATSNALVLRPNPRAQQSTNQRGTKSGANNDSEESNVLPPSNSLTNPPAELVPGNIPTPAPGAPLPDPSILRNNNGPASAEAVDEPIVKREGDDKLHLVFQDTDVRTALKLISEQAGWNILATANVKGTVTATLTGVDVHAALQAITKNLGLVYRTEGNIVHVGTAEDFAAMDLSQDKVVMRVYRPNYIKAADLQALITPLLSQELGIVTVTTAAQVDVPSDQTKTGGNDFGGTDMVVVKDYENVLKQIDELFLQVDIKPTQVAIEAMIINVKLTDQYKMGINFEKLLNNGNNRLILNQPPASLASITATEGGLKFGFLDGSLSSLVAALEKIGDTNVVASPRVLCLNKQRAEVQIGEQLGYVNTTVTQTFSTQSVAFLDTGTLLRIRPFIGNDGNVRLEVHPELSTGSVSVSGSLTLPNKSLTQVTTNVMCPDGATIVLGGLIREDLQNTQNQVPFFGNLPWVGPLFRNKSENISRDEIIVLITPRIVSDAMLAKEGSCYGNEFLDRQNVFLKKLSPISQRNYAIRYQRLAKSALQAGDHATALAQIDWSLHFDPANRDSIALRHDIVEAGGFQESYDDYLNRAFYPSNRSRTDHSKNGGWKLAPAFGSELPPTYNHNPGTPGPTRTIERASVTLPALPNIVPTDKPDTSPSINRLDE